MPRTHPPLPGTTRQTRGQKLDADQLGRLDQLLTQQPITGLTDTAITKIIPCHRNTVIKRRRALQDQARVQERIDAGEPPPTKPARDEPQSAHDLLRDYADIATLTPTDTMRLLSVLALTSVNPAAQVQALSTLERLRAELEPADEKAPKPPLTLDEKVQRTMQVLDAAGVEVAQQAIQKLWPDA